MDSTNILNTSSAAWCMQQLKILEDLFVIIIIQQRIFFVCLFFTEKGTNNNRVLNTLPFGFKYTFCQRCSRGEIAENVIAN